MERKPLFVDLDVNQSSLSVPGSVSAILVERPASIEDGFSINHPLVYHYGHTSPGKNVELFSRIVSRMADVVRERMKVNSRIASSGVIINTFGFERGKDGYKQLKQIALSFEADVIIVLDQERLRNDFEKDINNGELPPCVKVVLADKSSGVVSRTLDQKTIAKESQIKQYFYGVQGNLFPHTFDFKFADIKDKIFKIGAPQLPESCMPLGYKAEDNQTKVVPVSLTSKDLLNHILSCSFATNTDELIVSNVAGFMVITDVNVKEQRISVLSPQPKSTIPTSAAFFLLAEDVRYIDSS